MQTDKLRANILMLITAMIWGSTFLGQNVAMNYMGALTFSGVRFLLGTLTLLPIIIFYLKKNKLTLLQIFSKRTIIGGFLLGIILTIGINLQQIGIKYTTITNAGFITGLYVILVPILGLIIGQKTGLGIWIGAILAVIGMALLTITDHLTMGFGDLITLSSAFAWGLHVLIAGLLVSRYDPIAVAFMQCLVCSIFSLLLAIPFEGLQISFTQPALLAIFFTGIVSVAISFTLQLIAQKDAVPSHAAVILSLEAVFAAIFGALFLDESLTTRGYIGCILMFIGMIIAQIWPTKKQPSATNNS
ncbi:DMT family transporter [Entomomonas asaccharolytica]|uniref:DMT family transporter n=1 Tax=Entomomonas asaccharolytica TaxID=2785331 RepID=A0A974RXI4_9GAMM|nr:DMT family transporter [Entomomonas asaccharolytica]QQP86210.1 DMT family transporter [Entomomonas asaccharolytica]